MEFWDYFFNHSNWTKLQLEEGDGLIYIHAKPGKATHVLMTLDRFEREMGGDPGHSDDFYHTHWNIVT